ncbi:hypothetical protein IAQ61_007010 [Plenodomus lingam]|uniref:uncharacterized protein n=1 Tax=Leptosphaeria maculans TaxID=5022 RepID=UPI00332A1548|nr:hypothetical protein IAQ61_007010 [Plenodomus lingam]
MVRYRSCRFVKVLRRYFIRQILEQVLYVYFALDEPPAVAYDVVHYRSRGPLRLALENTVHLAIERRDMFPMPNFRTRSVAVHYAYHQFEPQHPDIIGSLCGHTTYVMGTPL